MQRLPHSQVEKAKIHSVCRCAAEVFPGWSLSSLCSCPASATKSANAVRLEDQGPSSETRGKGDALVSMSPRKVLSTAGLKHHEALIVCKNCTLCLICNGSLSFTHHVQNTPSIPKAVILIRGYWDTGKENKLDFFFYKVWQLEYYVKAPDF